MASDKASPKKPEAGLGETIRVILEALVIALVVRTFLFQPFNIPSGSLIPTLLVGDYLFVSKYAYGYSKHSFPYSILPAKGRSAAIRRAMRMPATMVSQSVWVAR